MHIYKIIFVNNSVADCVVLNRKVDLNGDYSFDHIKGKLIYAMVKAPSEEAAIAKGKQIADQFKEKKYGTDFIE